MLIILCESGLLLQPWSTATTHITNSRMAPTATILSSMIRFVSYFEA